MSELAKVVELFKHLVSHNALRIEEWAEDELAKLTEKDANNGTGDSGDAVRAAGSGGGGSVAPGVGGEHPDLRNADGTVGPGNGGNDGTADAPRPLDPAQ